jgi:hypothetical protein
MDRPCVSWHGCALARHGCAVKCPECGVQEDENGARWHAPHCPFAGASDAPIVDVPALEPVPRTGTGEAVEAAKPMRVMQFVGNVELTPEGEPLRVTVLISGGLTAVYELGEDSELSIGDAVDLALTRAGRRLLSVDVS